MQLDEMVSLIKSQKDGWVKATKRGDIPPTVIVEKNDEILCIVYAPQVDKMLGLRALDVLQSSFDPDFLTLAVDAHYAKAPPGTTEEEFAEMYPPGSMQKMCDEENACALGKIVDCLNVIRVGRDAKMEMIMVPYSYHGEGTEFVWLEDDEAAKSRLDERADDGGKIGGYIPSSMRRIMTETSDAAAMIKMFGNLVMAEDENEVYLRAGRSGLSFLLSEDYFALVSPTLMKYGPLPGQAEAIVL